MAGAPRIFISYSTKDRSVAQRLHTDLSEQGADVFEFEESATPGTEAWDEVLSWIEKADFFIMLASRNALKSRPIRAEINFAYHQNVNENSPRIIPLMLEDDLRLPPTLRTFNRIPFKAYEDGLRRLAKILSGAPASTTEVPLPPRLPATPRPLGDVLTTSRTTPLFLRSMPTRFPTKTEAPEQAPLPNESTALVLARYAGTISIIALLAAIAGHFLSSWLATQDLGLIQETLRAQSEAWTWLPLASKIASMVIIAGATWAIAENEWPIDSLEYAIVTAKSAGVALILTVGWHVLFSWLSAGSATFVWIGIGITVGVLLIYAVVEEV